MLTDMGFTVVGIGELLWDMFPEGKKLGGAPANFAYHCKAFGLESFPVSCLGDDDLGREILPVLKSHDVDVSYIAIDAEHPTGTVSVELDENGKPEYIIHENVAWDHIPLTEEMLALAERTDAVCFGSLAQRSEISQQTIRKFLNATKTDCIKIYDINLRQHYYCHDLIEEMLKISTVLKLNDEELPVVAELMGISGEEKTLIEQIASCYSLDIVALTKGGNGSCLYHAGQFSEHDGYPAKIVDTVGAGDSFTAVLAAGLLLGYDLDKINDLANKTAAYVCSQSGAMPKMSIDIE
jgi:fructokinase